MCSSDLIPKSSLPTDIGSWNCKINREAIATYPIDQSDGGEDDDPQEHKQWSEQLAKLGRNPNLPWKSQNPALTIDSSKDYISDRGDEVWSILKKHQIDHVLMVGVHTNMCVLGRPFGLRQLVQNGLDVVLIRDLTDCMYNPNRWPYVDHYSGNDLLISYVEQTVCPTITSNQILGGKPIAFSKDKRESRDLLPSQIWGAHQEKQSSKPPEWELIEWDRILTVSDAKQTQQPLVRCSVRIPTQAFADSVTVSHPRIVKAWLNGHPLPPAISPNSANRFEILSSHTFGNDDANVLVLQLDTTGRTANAEGNPKPNQSLSLNPLPTIQRGSNSLPLGPTWQRKATWQDSDCNLPLPAKFALPPAIYYTLSLP